MLPVLLVLGMAMGLGVRDRASLGRWVGVAAALSILWGVAVGVAVASVATAAGGGALAAANVLVGAACSGSARAAWRAAARTGSRRRQVAPR